MMLLYITIVKLFEKDIRFAKICKQKVAFQYDIYLQENKTSAAKGKYEQNLSMAQIRMLSKPKPLYAHRYDTCFLPQQRRI